MFCDLWLRSSLERLDRWKPDSVVLRNLVFTKDQAFNPDVSGNQLANSQLDWQIGTGHRTTEERQVSSVGLNHYQQCRLFPISLGSNPRLVSLLPTANRLLSARQGRLQ